MTNNKCTNNAFDRFFLNIVFKIWAPLQIIFGKAFPGGSKSRQAVLSWQGKVGDNSRGVYGYVHVTRLKGLKSDFLP